MFHVAKVPFRRPRQLYLADDFLARPRGTDLVMILPKPSVICFRICTSSPALCATTPAVGSYLQYLQVQYAGGKFAHWFSRSLVVDANWRLISLFLGTADLGIAPSRVRLSIRKWDWSRPRPVSPAAFVKLHPLASVPTPVEYTVDEGLGKIHAANSL